MYVAEVESFTHKCKNQVIVSKKFLGPDDHVLIIDDFLANGCALQGQMCIRDSNNGRVLLDNTTPTTHTVLKASTASLLTQGMTSVITEGTGTSAKLDGKMPRCV